MTKDGSPTMADIAKQMLDAVKRAIARNAEPINAGLDEIRGKLAALPVPKDGVDGKDADPEAIARLVADEVAKAIALLPPAEKGDPGRDGRDAVDGRDGVDGVGEPGRDALDIVVLAEIDEAKIYPRGTFACYKGGMIRATRKTDPILDGLEKAGWKVCMNGIAGESEELLDDGRTIVRRTAYTNGQEVVTEFRSAMLIYRGIWKEGEAYRRGDVLTRGGSSFHCQVDDTAQTPGAAGADDWKMMVKSGRPGQDGKPGPVGPMGPQGKGAH